MQNLYLIMYASSAQLSCTEKKNKWNAFNDCMGFNVRLELRSGPWPTVREFPKSPEKCHHNFDSTEGMTLSL